MGDPSKLRVYVDADVLYAGSTTDSTTSASHVILRLSELTLIDGISSELALEECRRTIKRQAPNAVPRFVELVDAAVDVVRDPDEVEIKLHRGKADPKDVLHLVAALREGCPYLATFNLRDYTPGHPDVEVVEPGEILERARARLTAL